MSSAWRARGRATHSRESSMNSHGGASQMCMRVAINGAELCAETFGAPATPPCC